MRVLLAASVESSLSNCRDEDNRMGTAFLKFSNAPSLSPIAANAIASTAPFSAVRACFLPREATESS